MTGEESAKMIYQIVLDAKLDTIDERCALILAIVKKYFIREFNGRAFWQTSRF